MWSSLLTLLNKKNVKWIKVLIPLVALIFLYIQTRNFLHNVAPASALILLRSLQPHQYLLLAIASCASIAVMTLYDMAILGASKKKLRPLAIFKVAWIANTFNNLIGLAGLTGTGIRYFLYRKRELEDRDLSVALYLLSISMVTGLSVMVWLFVIGGLDKNTILAGRPWLLWAQLAAALYLPIYFIMVSLPSRIRAWGQGQRVPIKRSAALVAISTAEWLAAAFLLWLVCRTLQIPMPFMQATTIIVAAGVVGLFSLLPGGVGSFDAVLFMGLQSYGVDPTASLAALLLFRIFYYFFPWIIGLALASTEWTPKRQSGASVNTSLWMPAWNQWQSFWRWPGQFGFIADIGNWALAALVFISGAILLIAAAIPGVIPRMEFMDEWFSPSTMKFAQRAIELFALLLLIVSHGIRRQMRRAYYATLFLLAGGVCFLLLKDFEYEVALFLSVIFLLLWLSKDRFRREDAVLSVEKLIVWAVFSAIFSVMYVILGDLTDPVPYKWVTHHAPLPNMKHIHHISHYLLRHKDLVRNATICVLLTWAFLTARFLFQSGRVRTLYPDPKQITKLRQLLERVSGHFLTHLLFIGDKPFFWSKDNEAVLAYRRVGKLLIVLGDPIGQESSVRCIIREFRTFADLHGHIPVFYQIKAEMLPFYHENGYRFFMLGEEGVLKLDTFSLTGSHKKDLRAVHNRFEREGYRFEVESPPFTPVRIRELKEVSDVWLEGRKEKTFSIGTFQESYLHLAPIGQLRNREGELLAFASLMPSYDRGDSVSVDLTRHLPDVPNGVMDALFLHLFEWAKENGYKRFNLGMAPLSSVGESLYAHLSERVAHWLFRKGTSLYAFQGVRRFKSKFEPYWEPRYLAYPKRTFLPRVILGITRLISGKIKS